MTRLRAGAGAYYLADLGQELGEETPGRWVGTGAIGMGLTGRVLPDELDAVLDGRHPATGRTLARRRGVVAGFDLTFAAPKSASLLFGLGAPEVVGVVRQAHDEAVVAATGYLSDHGLAVRRGAGEDRRLLAVEGPVAAAFAHGVSRALDPHLHTHVVLANLGHGADGRWTALDSRGIHAHARAAGQLYDAQLRWRLRGELGVDWTGRRSGAYEADGLDPAVLGAFSGRRADILAELAGRHSAAARTVAWAATRPPKVAERTAVELRRWWQERARLVDPQGQSVVAARLSGRAMARSAVSGDVDEHRFAADLWRTPHAGATRRDAVAAWAGALAQGSSAIDVGRCVDQLASWGSEVGVAEGARALGEVVPAPRLLRLLGARPAAPAPLATWQRAAAAVERYRGRWAVGESDRVLGVDGTPASLARLSSPRLADHLAVERTVREARRQLGRDRGRDADGPERSLGRW